MSLADKIHDAVGKVTGSGDSAVEHRLTGHEVGHHDDCDHDPMGAPDPGTQTVEHHVDDNVVTDVAGTQVAEGHLAGGLGQERSTVFAEPALGDPALAEPLHDPLHDMGGGPAAQNFQVGDDGLGSDVGSDVRTGGVDSEVSDPRR